MPLDSTGHLLREATLPRHRVKQFYLIHRNKHREAAKMRRQRNRAQMKEQRNLHKKVRNIHRRIPIDCQLISQKRLCRLEGTGKKYS